MALTDLEIRKAKPKERDYKLSDGEGLFLLIRSTGSKLWRMKFRYDGKEKLLSFGPYPEITLADARELKLDARKSLFKGLDPAREKRREKARRTSNNGNTFETVAREYLDKRKREGMAAVTLGKQEWLLGLLKPDIGALPVMDIEPVDILTPLRKIERKGNHETARRALQLTSRVLRYAISTARLSSDPSRDLRGALTTPQVTHFAAITDVTTLGQLLRSIEAYSGRPTTRLALQMSPHVFQRPGEVRQMRWDEIDFERSLWKIPASRMKMRREHEVPLSRQALSILNEAKTLVYDGCEYVFPAMGKRNRPLSENTVTAALRRMGYSGQEMTSHGFRTTASSLLNESGRWNPDAIERALAHKDQNATRGIYNQTRYWAERVQMAQWWSDHLETLREGAEIMKFAGKERL